MSRIGNLPVPVPSGVKAAVSGNSIEVKGPKGLLTFEFSSRIVIRDADGCLVVSREGNDRNARALHGLTRALVNNMVLGVSRGFTKILNINGLGYRAAVVKDILELNLGFSHPIRYAFPKEIEITVEKGVRIVIHGIDKQKVGQVAAEIKAFRPVEPYKGKGVMYEGEYVRRKAGKTGA